MITLDKLQGTCIRHFPQVDPWALGKVSDANDKIGETALDWSDDPNQQLVLAVIPQLIPIPGGMSLVHGHLFSDGYPPAMVGNRTIEAVFNGYSFLLKNNDGQCLTKGPFVHNDNFTPTGAAAEVHRAFPDWDIAF